MERNQARENFKALLKGTPSRRELTLAEAKARLRAADPAIDIGIPLKHLNQGEIQKAGITFAVETAATVTLPYLRPALTAALLSLVAPNSRRSKRNVS